MNVEIVGNRKALSTVRNKKKELKDLDNHAYQSGSETSSNVVDALDSVDELETDLDQSKGLLSLMLSLPEDWDYTTKGLAQICKEGVDSISTALKELEKHGYLTRHRIRYKNGQLGDVEYTIHERPLDHNERGISPDQENPEQVKPIQDNPAQLNTNIQNTKKQNTNLSINLSALGTDYKAGGIKSNLTEGSRILYRHDRRDFKDDGKRTDSITADCRSSSVSGLRSGEDISPDGKTGDK